MKALLTVVVSIMSFAALAKDTSFTNAASGTDSWSESGNWSNGVPASGDNATLTVGSTVQSLTVDVEGARLERLTAVNGALLSVKSNDGAPTRLEVGELKVNDHNGRLAPDANTTIAVEGMNANGAIRHEGAGKIVFEKTLGRGSVDSIYQGNNGGHFAFAATPTVPADGAVVHLDADDPTAFEYKTPGDPSSGVIRWNGVNGAGYAYHDLAVAQDGVTQVLPQRRENATGANGRAIVDFGPLVDTLGGVFANRPLGGYLFLQCGPSQDLEIYTAFVVECTATHPFTAYYNNTGRIIHGTGKGWSGNSLATFRKENHVDFYAAGTSVEDVNFTGLGLTRFNGAVVNAWQTTFRGEDIYDTLVMRAETAPIYIGRLALDRVWRTGGAKIAEIILYSRKLSDEEILATEGYLRNKWQNANVTITVPETPNVVPQIVNAGRQPVRINEGVTVSATLIDANDLSAARRGFTGGGTLKLERSAAETTVGAETTVEIGDGTLVPVVAETALSAPATNPITDTTFHLDASDASTFTLNADGTVLEWRDVTGNGRAAVAPWNTNNKTYIPPRRVEALLNGKAGVDFGDWNSSMCMLWNHTNTTMRTVFVVYGTVVNNQSFLIGNVELGNNNLACCFHRGDRGTMFYVNYTANAIRNGDVRVNGRPVSWNGHYLNQEPSVVMLASKNDNETMCGSAFAVDRWGGEGGRTGGQQICEVVVYDRVLGDEEKDAVQNWLIAKWIPRTPAGFALKDGEEQFDEIRSVAAADETATVKVDDGEVRIGALSGANVVKTGEGTLKIGSVADLSGSLEIDEGVVDVAARTLPADWTPPGGYTTDGAVVVNVRAVFAVYDQASAGTVPQYFQSSDANDIYRVDGVRGNAIPAGLHVASVVSTTRRATWNIDTSAPSLKELLVYCRAVTDLERRDIEAYLARKWNVGALPGYAGASQCIEEVVAAGGTLKATGAPLSVNAVSGSGDATFQGSVTVGDASGLTGSVEVPAGTTLTFSGKTSATETSVPTNGLIARFDMSHRESLTTVEENGKTFVTEWRDMTGQHVATAGTAANRPWILEGDCNGLDVLCTGPYVGYGSDNWESRMDNETGFMYWDNRSIKARTVIEVIGVQEGGSFIVTAYPGSPCIHRGGGTGGSYSDSLIASRNETWAGNITNAFYSINGSRIANPTSTGFPSPDYHSVAVRVDPDFQYEGEQTYFYVGQFGQDRTWRWGGQRICEFIAYDRVLSDGELASLEAYLQKKWFGRAYDGYANPETSALALSGGTVDLGGDGRVFASVSGYGTITGGQLNVTETFAPAAGGLNIAGTLNFAAPNGTIVLPVTPAKGDSIDLGAVGGISGEWATWTVTPLPTPDSRFKLKVRNGRLCAYVIPDAFIISIR